MRASTSTPRRYAIGRMVNLLTSFRKDRRGVTAIEFAMVAAPFLMLTMGIMGSGLYFFTDNGLQNAVETASRKIRTGQAQRAGTTVDQFRQEICNAGTFLDCSKLQVTLQKGASWGAITPDPCVDATGTLVGSSGAPNDPIEDFAGGAGEVVLVTACYQWDLANSFDFMGLGNMASGGSLIQAASTFRTEPYQ